MALAVPRAVLPGRELVGIRIVGPEGNYLDVVPLFAEPGADVRAIGSRSDGLRPEIGGDIDDVFFHCLASSLGSSPHMNDAHSKRFAAAEKRTAPLVSCAARVSRYRNQEAFWLLQTSRTNASIGKTVASRQHHGAFIGRYSASALMQPLRGKQSACSERYSLPVGQETAICGITFGRS